MIHQPPAGARDLFPLEVAQKCWINDRLQVKFQQWGYQRIVTSTLEWLDTLTAGGAIKPSTVIQIQDNSEKTLGLRPELTASIARAAVTRMAGNTYPQRLCYRANVFRNPPQSHHGRQLEFYQAGVELLFAGGVLADAEILLLLADCLEDLGIQNWHILLGDAGLTRSLLNIFPTSVRQQVRYCLANLDRITLENLPLEPALKEQALLLFDLRGFPKDVLAKVAHLDLDDEAQAIVRNLKSLVDLLDRSSTASISLTLDLSLVQTIDYYTGIVFELVSYHDNQSYIIGQGGRYDRLLGLYHPQGETSPGIGFAFNIEDLHSCLLPTGKLPQQTLASDWLVIPQTPQAESAAFIYAQKLRNTQPKIRVELDLGGRSPEEIKEYARTSRIKNLAWIQEDGTVTTENV
ncbi:MAG: ATP phosphoribosyltransferase regulatory subunit [Xenococcaceae cyanobacterium MO_188.B32]|nr:ATP phosphoribosyltransferase regulatory subunit [Xenococcaceae cyanobacterium MO_188.B32]